MQSELKRWEIEFKNGNVICFENSSAQNLVKPIERYVTVSLIWIHALARVQIHTIELCF